MINFKEKQQSYIFSFKVLYFYIHCCSQNVKHYKTVHFFAMDCFFFVYKIQSNGFKKCNRAVIGHIDHAFITHHTDMEIKNF